MKTKLSIIAITIALLMLTSSLPRGPYTHAVSNQHSANVVINFNRASLPSNYASIVASAGGQVLKAIPDVGIVDAQAVGVSSDTFLANVQADSHVQEAGYDIVSNLVMPVSVVADDSNPDQVIPPPPTTILGAPARDRYYIEANGNVPSNQWAVRQVGGYGTGCVSVGVCGYGPTGGAWDTTTGSSAVTIAIIDTGVSPLHPDVGPKVVDAQSSIFGTTANPYDDGSPDDQVGHGTWTSSLAAASLDPAGGIGATVGVAPGVNIANLKVLTRTASGGGSGEFAWTVAAIVYAANMGYQVISMSLGGYADLQNKGDHAVYVALIRATNYAYNHGSILFAAAGNDGLNLDTICNPHVTGSPASCLKELPGELPHVIPVVATTNPACVENLAPSAVCASGAEGLAFYSNYGTRLGALAAPGGSLPAAGAIGNTGYVRGACSPGKASNNYSKCFTLGNVYYVRAIGTSAATPLAAGAAALLFSVLPGLRPNMVQTILQQSATNIGPKIFFGYGEVNAAAALQLALHTNFHGADAGDILSGK